MEIEELRLCLFDALRSRPDTQWENLVDDVDQIGQERRLLPREAQGQRQISCDDQEKLRIELRMLMIQGLVVEGINGYNAAWPWFKVTPYGQQVLSSPEPVPHDPDRYLEHLQTIAPIMDAVSLRYVSEGLRCFRTGAYTAAAVMLGVAGEHLMISLATTVQRHLEGQSARTLEHTIARNGIAKVFEETQKRLQPHLASVPTEITDGMDTMLNGIFDIIRRHRNKSGHPSGEVIDGLTALGLFATFPFYCERLSALVGHIEANGLRPSSYPP